MTDYYVNSGGGAPSSPYANWTDAAATVAAAITAGAGAGDTIYVHYTHSETPTALIDWNGPTSYDLGPLKIISVDKDNSDAYTPRTGTPNFYNTGDYDIELDGCMQIYGLYFKPGDNFHLYGDYNEGQHLQDCIIDLSDQSLNTLASDYGTYATLKDCTITCGSNGRIYSSRGRIDVVGGSMSGSGAYMIDIDTDARIMFQGVDCSGWTGTNDIRANSIYPVEMYGCDLPTSASLIYDGTGGLFIYESDDSSSNLATRNEKLSYDTGSVTTETGVYRSGGGTYDGTNEYSYLINGVAGAPNPVSTDWNAGYISSTGSKTFTVYIANATADYKDNEVWLEVEYFGASGSTLKTIGSDGDDDPTSAGTTQTDDTSSTWSPSKTYMQKLEVTATVNRAGSFRWRVCSMVTTDIYVDPAIEVT